MKALIGGQTQILSTPSFRNFWRATGFPVHDVVTWDISIYTPSANSYVQFETTNSLGELHDWYYGPFTYDVAYTYFSALELNVPLNGLTGGEFFNRLLRHQLISKDIPPP